MNHVTRVISNPGGKLFITRITLINTSGTLPFTKKRRELPIKPAFGIIANKAKGRTLSCVVIYICSDFISHNDLNYFF